MIAEAFGPLQAEALAFREKQWGTPADDICDESGDEWDEVNQDEPAPNFFVRSSATLERHGQWGGRN